MKLYVGNLSYSAGENELRELFSQYGAVASVAVITDRDTGRSKGFGFVEFANDAEAQAAIAGLNGKDVGGPQPDGQRGASASRGWRGRELRRIRRGRRRTPQPVLIREVDRTRRRPAIHHDWKIRIQPAERTPFVFKATFLQRGSANDEHALDVLYAYGDGDLAVLLQDLGADVPVRSAACSTRCANARAPRSWWT